MPIPVIDLFAGPGGLGEGFSLLLDENGERVFKIGLSIEKDGFAHATLTLRSFLRQFPPNNLPHEYYQFVRGEIDIKELYARYPEPALEAKHEAQKIELGKYPEEDLDDKIRTALAGQNNWVLIGGPPCQAYSIVGRSRRGGIDPTDERLFLYREYYRILAVHSPSIFIMENVKGMLSSKVNNSFIFQQILSDLKDPVKAYKELQGTVNNLTCPGYNIYSLVQPPKRMDMFGNPEFAINDFIIKAEDYGIPQTRHRVILLGIRRDLNVGHIPTLLKQDEIPVKRVITGLPKIRSGISKSPDSKSEWRRIICSAAAQPFFNEILDEKVKKAITQAIKALSISRNEKGKTFIKGNVTVGYNEDWFIDENLGGAVNHECRSHIIKDLYRYLFASCFASVHKRSPKLFDYPSSLLPQHKNVQLGVNENKFGDRFRVQLFHKPAKTITSHISKDGHYYIHPDPGQCRSLTVREAARIQTFPDNYFFCGPRTSQFHQVGNAVPPLLAYKIAMIVSKLV